MRKRVEATGWCSCRTSTISPGRVASRSRKGCIEKRPWLGVSLAHELVTGLAHEIVGIDLRTAQRKEAANDPTPAALYSSSTTRCLKVIDTSRDSRRM
jgi:hypothetical protein